MSVLSLCLNVVDILSVSDGTDAYGAVKHGYSVKTSSLACRIASIAGQETVSNGKEMVIPTHRIFFPCQPDIDETDIIVEPLTGKNWDVVLVNTCYGRHTQVDCRMVQQVIRVEEYESSSSSSSESSNNSQSSGSSLSSRTESSQSSESSESSPGPVLIVSGNGNIPATAPNISDGSPNGEYVAAGESGGKTRYLSVDAKWEITWQTENWVIWLNGVTPNGYWLLNNAAVDAAPYSPDWEYSGNPVVSFI